MTKTEVDKPEEKLAVYCEGCEDYVNSVEDVDIEGYCMGCNEQVFQSRRLQTKRTY